MSLIVTTVSEALYTAAATPPHSREEWATKEPIRLHQLCKELLAIGLHQVDVGDAIDEADRKWLQGQTP